VVSNSLNNKGHVEENAKKERIANITLARKLKLSYNMISLKINSYCSFYNLSTPHGNSEQEKEKENRTHTLEEMGLHLQTLPCLAVACA